MTKYHINTIDYNKRCSKYDRVNVVNVCDHNIKINIDLKPRYSSFFNRLDEICEKL